MCGPSMLSHSVEMVIRELLTRGCAVAMGALWGVPPPLMDARYDRWAWLSLDFF